MLTSDYRHQLQPWACDRRFWLLTTTAFSTSLRCCAHISVETKAWRCSHCICHVIFLRYNSHWNDLPSQVWQLKYYYKSKTYNFTRFTELINCQYLLRRNSPCSFWYLPYPFHVLPNPWLRSVHTHRSNSSWVIDRACASRFSMKVTTQHWSATTTASITDPTIWCALN